MFIRSKFLEFDNLSIFIVSFFLFSGFYLGLELMISMGMMEKSRFYTVPLRIFLVFIMSLYILKHIKTSLNSYQVCFIVSLFCFSVFYILLIILNLNSQLYMLSKMEYIFYYVSYSFLPLFFYIFVEKSKYNVIIIALIISNFLFSLMSFFLYSDLFFGGLGRISRLSYEGNQNFLSPLILSYGAVFNFLISWIYFREFGFKNNLLKIIVLSTILLSIPMFILGASRGSFVSIILLFIYIIVVSNFRVKLVSLLVLPLFTYFVYLISLKTGSNAFDRFLGIKESVDNNDSSAIRLEIWKQGFDYFLQSPIYGGYLEVNGIYPHNIFIEILMNSGLVGTFLLFFPISLIFVLVNKASLRQKRSFIPLFFIFGLSMQLFSGSIYFAIILFSSLGIMIGFLSSTNKEC